MKMTFLTLFPEFYDRFFETKMNKRALEQKIIEKEVVNIRDFSNNKHKHVDDTPCGGGAGMVMKVDVVASAIRKHRQKETKVILVGPRGKTLNQDLLKTLSGEKHLILLAGHYEGIDYRIKKDVDMEISIGDYILSGGELATMVIADGIIRLLDNVLNPESIIEESFENGLLEYPQYTRPINFEDEEVPQVLLSGNHEKIRLYRLKESLKMTKELRPDLFSKHIFNEEEKKLLKELEDES